MFAVERRLRLFALPHCSQNEVTFEERKCLSGETGLIKEYLQSNTSANSTPQRSPSPALSNGQFASEPDIKEPHLRAARLWMTASTALPRNSSPLRRVLSPGNTIYWRHLLPAGELSTSLDPRVRAVPILAAGR